MAFDWVGKMKYTAFLFSIFAMIFTTSQSFAAPAQSAVCGKISKFEYSLSESHATGSIVFGVTLDSGKSFYAVEPESSLMAALGAGLTLCFNKGTWAGYYEFSSASNHLSSMKIARSYSRAT